VCTAFLLDLIDGIGRSADQLRHLVFTHGHPDHIGSAAAIVRKTGARTYMHPFDICTAESGGPFRPMRPAPGLLGQVLCRLFFDPDERMEAVAIDQPLTDGEILPIAGGIEVIHTLGIARDTSHCCGIRDACCSRAMCARTSWASAIPSASRIWSRLVRASANLPVFHSMRSGSATASLSPAMRRRSSAISGARNWLPDMGAPGSFASMRRDRETASRAGHDSNV
jgi:Metallo-beta-lactamase superfamily